MAPISSSHLAISATIIITLVAMTTGALIWKPDHARQQRSVMQMCRLITEHTNRGCFQYYNYGCYCGLGNSDTRPVDAADRCCRAHDNCYGNINCFWVYPPFITYSYQCDQDRCTCTDTRSFYSCAYATCQCDLQLAQCLGRSRFNHRFSYYSRDRCIASNGPDRTTANVSSL